MFLNKQELLRGLVARGRSDTGYEAPWSENVFRIEGVFDPAH
jgi:hypothetical protein